MTENVRGMNIYETLNLAEASYLYARGFKFNGSEKRGSRTVFFFEGCDVRSKAIEFYNGGQIEAKSILDAYRTLKDVIFC